MAIVAEAVYNAFQPDKLNYELLGAGDGTITIMVIYKSNLPMRIKKLLKMRKAVKMTIKKITTKKTQRGSYLRQ